jgi:hypothetical protein
LSVEREKLAKEAIELARQKAEMEMRKLNEEREKILKELDMNATPQRSVPSSKTTGGQSIDQAGTQAEKGNETLESLVVYTKSGSSKTLPMKKGKARSSISKSLGTVHRVKQPLPALTTRLSKPAPTRNRAAVLKSLLSITGDEEQAIPTSSTDTATISTTTTRKPILPHKSLARPSARPVSSSSRLRNEPSAAQNKLTLGKSNSRITRPPP